MRYSEALHGVHGEFLSQVTPESLPFVLKDLKELEFVRGRDTTAGGFVGDDRDTLVLFRDDDSDIPIALGAAVIHRLPAVDMLFNNRFTVSQRMHSASYLQARVEGYLHGLGQREYLAVVPLEGEPGWTDHIRRLFDSEQFPSERFAVFRRRL